MVAPATLDRLSVAGYCILRAIKANGDVEASAVKSLPRYSRFVWFDLLRLGYISRSSVGDTFYVTNAGSYALRDARSALGVNEL